MGKAILKSMIREISDIELSKRQQRIEAMIDADFNKYDEVFKALV